MCHDSKQSSRNSLLPCCMINAVVACCCPFQIFFACSPSKKYFLHLIFEMAYSLSQTHTHTLTHCISVCGRVVCVLKHPRFVHLHEHLGTQPKGLSAPDSVLKSPLKCTLIKLLEGESVFFLTFISVITDVCGSWLWCSPPQGGWECFGLYLAQLSLRIFN